MEGRSAKETIYLLRRPMERWSRDLYVGIDLEIAYDRFIGRYSDGFYKRNKCLICILTCLGIFDGAITCETFEGHSHFLHMLTLSCVLYAKCNILTSQEFDFLTLNSWECWAIIVGIILLLCLGR